MTKTALIFILGFLIGSLWGQQIVDFVYLKVHEIKASVLGQSAIIVDTDYLSIKRASNELYIYLDIDKPIKTVLYIPLNESEIYYTYNISPYIDSVVSGNQEDLSVMINHKMPVIP